MNRQRTRLNQLIQMHYNTLRGLGSADVFCGVVRGGKRLKGQKERLSIKKSSWRRIATVSLADIEDGTCNSVAIYHCAIALLIPMVILSGSEGSPQSRSDNTLTAYSRVGDSSLTFRMTPWGNERLPRLVTKPRNDVLWVVPQATA